VSETAKLILGGALVVVFVTLLALVSQLAPRPLETFVFYIFGAAVAVSSLGIVLTRNIVRAATWLLGTLAAAAGLYLLMSANFLAAVQLIVYAGGILILIVFGVMLTARNPYIRSEAPLYEVLLAGLVGLSLFGIMTAIMTSAGWPALRGAVPTAAVAEVHDIGRSLLTDYLVPFEVISVLLLAVMIGAAYLARPEKR
jgi:NADH-quinone oxidoreductase subunit J